MSRYRLDAEVTAFVDAPDGEQAAEDFKKEIEMFLEVAVGNVRHKQLSPGSGE